MNVYRSLLFSLGLLVAIAQAHAAAFIVRDIQVEGLQRISAGTVFNYLPVQVGSTISEKDYPDIIRALFKTGFFTDVNLERRGEVLVITVTERPAIAEVKITGNSDISTDDLKKALTGVGLAEGRVFGPGGAAEMLGIPPTTLASRMKTLGIEHRGRRGA